MSRLVPSVSRTDLITISEARVFFGHQSVGRAVLEALPHVYAIHDLSAPHVTDLADAEAGDHLVHTRIGQNGDPLGKIAEYDALIRGGIGDWVDAAILKLCYSDVRAETDVDRVFAAYHETLTGLAATYPAVAFVPATVPLTTRRSRAGTLKQWLRRGDRHGPEHNVAREDFNALVRAEYAATGHLFDIASVESTTDDGRLVVGRYRGRTDPALDRARASDHGHLNELGAQAVATALLAGIATALSR